MFWLEFTRENKLNLRTLQGETFEGLTIGLNIRRLLGNN